MPRAEVTPPNALTNRFTDKRQLQKLRLDIPEISAELYMS